MAAEKLVAENASKESLTFTIEYTESFPSTYIEETNYQLVEKVIRSKDISFLKKDEPFKWSEDFGHYKFISNILFFGLGAGLDCPMLHNETYDFPDEIIEDGVNIYMELIKAFENEDF